MRSAGPSNARSHSEGCADTLPRSGSKTSCEAGIIDEKGRVLVRMPEPPKTKEPKKKKKPKAETPSAAEGTMIDTSLNGAACFMSEEVLLQRMREAIRKYGKIPPEVRTRDWSKPASSTSRAACWSACPNRRR